MRVSFDGGRLNERGVAVALHDYARHARRLIGVEPVILHDARGTVEDDQVARFAADFPVRAYRSDAERARWIEEERIDVAYALKTTRPRYPLAPRGRTVVHEVFRFFDPHGDAYAYISPWMAETAAAGRYPAVPHIVDPPNPQRRPARRVRRAARGGGGRAPRRTRSAQRSLCRARHRGGAGGAARPLGDAAQHRAACCATNG